MRSTSNAMNDLNGNSTPTGTIKKKVSFADTAGFTLEFVKTIPPESYKDVTLVNTARNHKDCGLLMHSLPRRMKFLSPSFVDPYLTDEFIERVYRQNVCLESISCNDLVVTGAIRVTNICFAKEVTVRFTLDEWKSFRDVWADYLSSNLDGKTEQFSFRITVPVDFEVDSEMQFAIRYCVAEQEFWDNNSCKNYRVKCLELPRYDV